MEGSIWKPRSEMTQGAGCLPYETNKDFFQKPIKGRGYVDTGGSVISEFYTPLVPRGYDFLTEIGAAANTVPATPIEQEVPNEH